MVGLPSRVRVPSIRRTVASSEVVGVPPIESTRSKGTNHNGTTTAVPILPSFFRLSRSGVDKARVDCSNSIV